MKIHLLRLLVISFLATFFLVIYKLYIPRAAAFGCFDDCFNYGAGFFLTKGKILFKDIFFNHQPSMAYISAFIQTVTRPINIYELLVRHRQFILIWNFVWSLVLISGVGLPALGFTLLYEITKFYIFGDRFLAEGLIVYPFIYITSTLYTLMQRKKITRFRYITSSLAGVFILFSREPYMLTAGIILILITLKVWVYEAKKILILFPALLTIFLLLLFPLQDYWMNVVSINVQTVLTQGVAESKLFGSGFIEAFFYPIYIAVTPSHTFFHQILLFVDLLFLVSLGLLLSKKKYWSILTIFFLILGTVNLRIVPVGQMFYSSFHLLPWYGLFIFITLLLIQETHRIYPRLGKFLYAGSFCVILFSLCTREAFFYEKIDSQTELINNYGEEIKVGNAIRHLSSKSDTLFLDGWAELIYWQADRISPYKYSWYTSVMPLISIYSKEKETMFRNNPPDFYYGTCPKEVALSKKLPEFAQTLYVQLTSRGIPTCLWVKKSKLTTISNDQWSKANELLFDKPL